MLSPRAWPRRTSTCPQAGDLELLDRHAQALGDPRRVVLRRAREQRELLATEAVEQLEGPQGAAHGVGDVAQHGVADAVAVVVVDRLEVVEVGQDDADRLVGERACSAISAKRGSRARRLSRPWLVERAVGAMAHVGGDERADVDRGR
jgi:hypothetical protein